MTVVAFVVLFCCMVQWCFVFGCGGVDGFCTSWSEDWGCWGFVCWLCVCVELLVVRVVFF